MALLALRDITHAFAGPPVLDGASLRLEAGDRVCLFGRNGEGKSTLLRIAAGVLRPDAGAVDIGRGASVGALEQHVPDGAAGTVYDVVTSGLGPVSASLRDYHRAAQRVADDPGEGNLRLLERAQAAVEAAGGWEAQERVETVVSRLGLDAEAPFAELSGGWRRRAFLAAALVLEPQVLLLDEPTNHLDVDAIEWLEGMLERYAGALLFVTHDRAFLRRVANRIVELDRGRLVEYPGDFDAYVEAKAHALEVEATHDAEFDRKLAQEEAWVRTGIKARRTRNEGRVRALQRLRAERARRRERKGKARIQIQVAERSGGDVILAEDVSFAYPGTPIVDGLTLTVKRGDRLGLVGPNGIGKTTLLRILLGELSPSSGRVRAGTRLEVRYFDQLRAELDPEETVAKTIVPKGEMLEIDGRQRHVVGYLRDFLFDDDQARQPVRLLSGGERNRLLLARLFAEPANVLVLDEPTNDLDIETLGLLEERLLAFPGTVLLVSHDREFLDNVVTQSLIFEGGGRVARVAGGYEAWIELRDARRAAEAAAERARTETTREARREARRDRATRAASGRDERRELDALPGRIEELEAEQTELHTLFADVETYRRDPERVAAAKARLEALEREIATAYARWEELEP